MKLGHEKLYLNKDKIYLLGRVANGPQWEIRTWTKFCVNLQRWDCVIHAQGNTVHNVNLFLRTGSWRCSKTLFPSTILSLIFCVSLFFSLILLYICPGFFFGMCCPSTARRFIVPSGSCFSVFMMNGDFGGL